MVVRPEARRLVCWHCAADSEANVGGMMRDTDAIDQERQRRGAELAADLRDAISFPPLPPSPAEVGDLILQTREHVQALGWGNREALYTATQVRAVMSECAIMSAARERERHADALRCALEALDYCIEDSAELLNERTVQWGSYRKDRQAAMAATLERHRAVAERLRAMLRD